MEEIKFALDTFYAVMAGALVMWMAAGFTMLEAGLVQKKDVSEIVTKNLGLYSIACIMYLVCGFMLMYPGGALWDGVIPSIGTSLGLSTGLPNEEIGMPYSMDYSQQADFFFQVVFVATAMSIVSGALFVTEATLQSSLVISVPKSTAEALHKPGSTPTIGLESIRIVGSVLSLKKTF